MNNFKGKHRTKSALLILILINLTHISLSQNNDSTVTPLNFAGAVSVTNKGISVIPNFTLGKPAVIFDLSIGKGKLSFEPQFKFALEGKPWSFIFRGRYKLLQSEKLQINIGVSPGISFRTTTFTSNSISTDALVANRMLSGELAPNYFFTKDISLGVNCFFAHILEKGPVKNTEMISLRSSFSNIRISKQLYFSLNPQIYYLKLVDIGGFYFSSSLALSKRDFPVSVSAFINKTIQTEIPADESFLWNVTLKYSFNKEYFEK
jgi:hypothetical protein